MPNRQRGGNGPRDKTHPSLDEQMTESGESAEDAARVFEKAPMSARAVAALRGNAQAGAPQIDPENLEAAMQANEESPPVLSAGESVVALDYAEPSEEPPSPLPGSDLESLEPRVPTLEELQSAHSLALEELMALEESGGHESEAHEKLAAFCDDLQAKIDEHTPQPRTLDDLRAEETTLRDRLLQLEVAEDRDEEEYEKVQAALNDVVQRRQEMETPPPWDDPNGGDPIPRHPAFGPDLQVRFLVERKGRMEQRGAKIVWHETGEDEWGFKPVDVIEVEVTLASIDPPRRHKGRTDVGFAPPHGFRPGGWVFREEIYQRHQLQQQTEMLAAQAIAEQEAGGEHEVQGETASGEGDTKEGREL